MLVLKVGQPRVHPCDYLEARARTLQRAIVRFQAVVPKFVCLTEKRVLRFTVGAASNCGSFDCTSASSRVWAAAKRLRQSNHEYKVEGDFNKYFISWLDRFRISKDKNNHRPRLTARTQLVNLSQQRIQRNLLKDKFTAEKIEEHLTKPFCKISLKILIYSLNKSNCGGKYII